MQTGFADRLLDVAFKFAKIVSVLVAMVLILAFLGGIGWSIKQSVGGGSGGDEDISFDNEMNQSRAGMSGSSAQGAAASGKDIALSNKLRGKYGDKLGQAMTSAQCSAEQYEMAMQILVRVAGNEETESFVGEMADGAIKWFNDASAYQKSVGGANTAWYCGNRYWEQQLGRLQARAEQRKQRLAGVLKGFEFSILALLAAFGLMVVPAIYRIEESVRNRPQA